MEQKFQVAKVPPMLLSLPGANVLTGHFGPKTVRT